jgi:hypothetical protein
MRQYALACSCAVHLLNADLCRHLALHLCLVVCDCVSCTQRVKPHSVVSSLAILFMICCSAIPSPPCNTRDVTCAGAAGLPAAKPQKRRDLATPMLVKSSAAHFKSAAQIKSEACNPLVTGFGCVSAGLGCVAVIAVLPESTCSVWKPCPAL